MPRVTSTLRSTAEQTRLYRRFQSGLQTLPVAPPGTSAHEFGYAFDMLVSPYDALSDVGDYWKSMGGVWGGEFNDPVHFEFPGFKVSARGLRAAPAAAGTGLVAEAVSALNALPWYVSMFLPMALATGPTLNFEETWAADVLRWIRTNA